MRGNVIDLAVGIVIGAAFTAIVAQPGRGPDQPDHRPADRRHRLLQPLHRADRRAPAFARGDARRRRGGAGGRRFINAIIKFVIVALGDLLAAEGAVAASACGRRRGQGAEHDRGAAGRDPRRAAGAPEGLNACTGAHGPRSLRRASPFRRRIDPAPPAPTRIPSRSASSRATSAGRTSAARARRTAAGFSSPMRRSAKRPARKVLDGGLHRDAVVGDRGGEEYRILLSPVPHIADGAHARSDRQASRRRPAGRHPAWRTAPPPLPPPAPRSSAPARAGSCWSPQKPVSSWRLRPRMDQAGGEAGAAAQPGRHRLAGQVRRDGAAASPPAGQRAGEEGGLLLQHLEAGDVGPGDAALRDREGDVRESRRHLRDAGLALAAMRDTSRRARPRLRSSPPAAPARAPTPRRAGSRRVRPRRDSPVTPAALKLPAPRPPEEDRDDRAAWHQADTSPIAR